MIFDRHLSWLISAGVTLLGIASLAPQAAAQFGMAQQHLALELQSVTDIWGGSVRQPSGVFDDHSAFTDLVRYQGDLFVAFRESTGHVPGTNGRGTVLRSTDEGASWNRVADLRKDDFPAYDLRDLKLSITATGDLMAYSAGANYTQGSPADRQNYASLFNPTSNSFGPLIEMEPTPGSVFEATESDWLWRMTWHNDQAYGIGYRASDQDTSRDSYLYRSDDGIHWDTVTEVVNPTNHVGESTIRFDDAGDMYLLSRGRFLQSGDPNNLGFLGFATAASGYTDFTWTPLVDAAGVHRELGGPNMIFTPEGEILVASRKVGSQGTSDGQSKTVLAQITTDGTWRDILELPSGGDTSYAGLVLEDDDLYVSYYSQPIGGGDPHIFYATLDLQHLPVPLQWNGVLGDVNQDGFVLGDGTGPVESDDRSAFIAGFGSKDLPGLFDKYTSYVHGDLNFDGQTDLLDLGLFRDALSGESSNLANGWENQLTVPEPATGLLMLMAVAVGCAASRKLPVPCGVGSRVGYRNSRLRLRLG